MMEVETSAGVTTVFSHYKMNQIVIMTLAFANVCHKSQAECT